MKNTLKDFLEIYNPTYIQLVFGKHLVNIDTMVAGSHHLIKTFYNQRFKLTKYNNDTNLLILTY